MAEYYKDELKLKQQAKQKGFYITEDEVCEKAGISKRKLHSILEEKGYIEKKYSNQWTATSNQEVFTIWNVWHTYHKNGLEQRKCELLFNDNIWKIVTLNKIYEKIEMNEWVNKYIGIE